jgi:hypothetical protein
MKNAVEKFEKMYQLTESWWDDFSGQKNKVVKANYVQNPEAQKIIDAYKNRVSTEAPKRMTFTIWHKNKYKSVTLDVLIKMLANNKIDPDSTEIFYNKNPTILSTIPEYPQISKAVQTYIAKMGTP